MKDTPQTHLSQIVNAGIFGLAVGNALGVPVEFQSRQDLKSAPVMGMRGGGTHGQPGGTWSDDTSLTLCLAESLCDVGINYHDQGRRFARWLLRGEWTPHGTVFDIGVTTRQAILWLDHGIEPLAAGLVNESNNGNGSLMRILPIAPYLAHSGYNERREVAMKCSQLTHGHPRSQLACAFFVELVAVLVRGNSLSMALGVTQHAMAPIIANRYPAERDVFSRLLSPQLGSFSESDISGSGYVIDCLEASLWCALGGKIIS